MARVILKRAEAEGGRLPRVCARCGALGDGVTAVTLPYTPSTPGQKVSRDLSHFAGHFPAAGLLGLALGLGVLLHGWWAGRRITLRLPLCARHALAVRRRALWLPLGGLLLGSLALGLTAAAAGAVVRSARQGVGPDSDPWCLAFSLAAILFGGGALLLRARLHDGFITALAGTGEEVELGGVAEGFAERRRQEAARRQGRV